MITPASFRASTLLQIAVCLLFSRAAISQTPPVSSPADVVPSVATPADTESQPERKLTPAQVADLEAWIEQLGSRDFAERERAAIHLMELGKPGLPALRKIVEETNDDEIRVRAKQIVKKLTDGDLQARIDDFLAGRDIDFDGWPYAERYLGSSPAARELFVEIMLSHPAPTKLLDGTPRERALALEGLLKNIGNKINTIRQEPHRADLFAMLLLGADPEVPTSGLLENLLIRLSHRPTASKIRRDAQLSGQFYKLFDRWILRTSSANREQVLLLGMSMDLPSTLNLALRTLSETTQTETIATSMQAISKFGDQRHAEALRRFLDDSRLASQRAIGNRKSLPQVGDLAMLTIALLHDLPLKEIGMGHIQTHPSAGFIPSDIAYQSDPEQSRKTAREAIDRLLSDEPIEEGS